MIRCSQMDQTEFQVESSSSTKKYRVRAFLPTEPPTCDCVAFAISRNRDGGKNHGGTGWCKHIKQITEGDICTWDEAHPEVQTLPGVCPRCGGPTSDTTPVVMPENPDKAAAAAVERLLAMSAELDKQ